MSGDNTISLDEVMTEDRFNFARIYDHQYDEVEPETTNPLSTGNDSEMCDYHEAYNLVNDLIKDGILYDDKHTQSYLHLNCRGLSSNWEKFQDLLCDMHSDAFSFDYIGISEVFRCDRDQRIRLPGYHNIITRCRDTTDGCRGGVALFIKDTTNYKIRDDLSVFIAHVYESLFVELTPKGGKPIIVGVIYRPNTFPLADINKFNNSLLGVMDQINFENKKGVIMGDMNIDMLKYGSHDLTDTYVDGIFSRGFLPRILKPTRVTRSSATLIDHILTNDITARTSSGIILNDVADHFAVFHISATNSKIPKPNVKHYRSFSNDNIAKFRSELSRTDFSEIMLFDCPNYAYTKFIDLYKTSFDTAFPLKTTTVKSRNMKREPWMTLGLLNSSRQKSKLYTRKLKKPTALNILQFKTYLKLFNKIKRKAKITYYKTILEENKHNIKQTWKVLKKAIGKEHDKINLPNTFNVENKSVSDKTEIADAFNNFFANIGYNVSHNVPSVNRDFSSYLPNHNVQSMFLNPVIPADIITLTSKFKPKTSYGADGISTKLLSKTIDIIVDPITHIVNLTLKTGIFPTDLKCAKVIPIHKSGDQCSLNNYRPISLLSSFSKIFERIMYNKIMNFLDENDILYRHQYGFRAKHSTIHPVLHLLNHCAEANNKTPSQMTLATFCDLSKAFDTISHNILLHKLNIFGIRGVANKWIESYLTNRSQFVYIDSHVSKNLPVRCGVPQGSILGPLLFLIYINDISNSTTENILSFADDTTVFLSDTDPTNLFNRANASLEAIFNWFCANKLSLNATKTQYMVMQPTTKNRDISSHSLTINNVILSQATSCKFLGITIDESFSWKKQLSSVNSKISRALFAIKQVKFSLPKDSLRTLYFSLIHPHLTYGILAWGNATANLLNKTTILQKRALRTIHNKKYNSHTDPLFKQSGILKLSDLYQQEVMLFMHDYAHDKLPRSFQNIYSNTRNIHGAYETRQAQMLFIPRTKSRFVDKLPLFNFPKIWNTSYNQLNLYTSHNSLKRSIKAMYLNSYATLISCRNPLCEDCRTVL